MDKDIQANALLLLNAVAHVVIYDLLVISCAQRALLELQPCAAQLWRHRHRTGSVRYSPYTFLSVTEWGLNVPFHPTKSEL